MGLRWQLPLLLSDTLDSTSLKELRDFIHPPLEPAHIVGCMPNIVSNRINKLFDFKAPSYSVSAEELSGITAMQIAIRDFYSFIKTSLGTHHYTCSISLNKNQIRNILI